MKIFQCTNCGNPIFFENHSCEKCGSLLGYLDTTFNVIALNPEITSWDIRGDGQQYRYCKNHEYEVCNWLVPTYENSPFCTACRLNRTIPNLEEKDFFDRWRRLELAKHRMVYSLQRLGLSVQSKLEYPETGLCFDFVSNDHASPNGTKLMTGHANGVITILLFEADTVNLELIKKRLNEQYRTLTGHFRHEVGHYYWDLLIKTDEHRLSAFRSLFGDETLNYADALQRHYNEGPPTNWQNDYVSEYASSHPWEDWAECWAHYMHIMSAFEAADSFGLQIHPDLPNSDHMHLDSFDPFIEEDFRKIFDSGIALFYAVNSINRSMGIPDVYPFVVSDAVVEKLSFIHELIWPFRAGV